MWDICHQSGTKYHRIKLYMYLLKIDLTPICNFSIISYLFDLHFTKLI